MSSNFYVACEFGEQSGRVWLGTLHRDGLTMSEVRGFQTRPTEDKGVLVWEVPRLCQEILTALRGIALHEEPVESVSCHSWSADSLLLAADGSLITPVYHHQDGRTQAGMNNVAAKLPWETLYDETGVQPSPANSIYQLAAEKSRRLERAAHFLPLADAFNFLLGGAPRSEASLASLTQLYNPVKRAWSEQVIEALRLPEKIFPQVVPAGTELGVLKPEIIKETGLTGTRVIASCSHEVAAMVAGLPTAPDENWAFLRMGGGSLVGTETGGPIVNDATRQLGFTNQAGAGGSTCFYKQAAGLWILDECKRYWKGRERELDDSVLRHLAISAPAFESLIDVTDPRFFTPGEMPVKIQEFCKETGQEVPRKPGPVIRCILESLALHFRNAIRETEYLTGNQFTRLYLLNGAADPLLPHFTANALQLPVVLLPDSAAAVGNVLMQALALGHVPSYAAAHALARHSFRPEIIMPHTAVWNAASDRLAALTRQ